MDKVLALEKLKQEMLDNKKLPLKTNLVFGEGSSDCQVLFIGEAPGAVEDQQVRPFVGRSGQLLRRCIRDLGWKEEEVYITNIVKRRPPENRDPLPQEIEAYKPYLTRQIEILHPKIIVTLGRFSMNYFLGREENKIKEILFSERATKICYAYFLPEAKITRDQGHLFLAGNLFVAPVFHPAAALRAPAMMEAFKKSFKNLPKILKKVDEMK
ncbi:MAG: hypothetical protein A3F47_01580 [Candidatus Staskawiczbacteria bacterium RIFCSPHIGHO2_12_FULL_38_11]|uniref:Type-4 uracil-DNA glycosylase n=1 Tax=Candidatus Staskawiczbacteria bacterium RIFCSPHIGHO2_12_FULL_38_11 TaxID=1802209 RepID=A0A1G2I5I4_9BACT|nr:MAG: hypothetical protein A3F47_01580 [Candidatus Staskawiczbacteria bacterium RIFCSPHIGHO2_12_FULL_38_11]